ncbi:MAG: hypothetical protein OEZ47_08165 [Gammaproteobacteria bacterium]|nr:hypothetical protein [Gammaproteobacteria bacterium]
MRPVQVHIVSIKKIAVVFLLTLAVSACGLGTQINEVPEKKGGSLVTPDLEALTLEMASTLVNNEIDTGTNPSGGIKKVSIGYRNNSRLDAKEVTTTLHIVSTASLELINDQIRNGGAPITARNLPPKTLIKREGKEYYELPPANLLTLKDPYESLLQRKKVLVLSETGDNTNQPKYEAWKNTLDLAGGEYYIDKSLPIVIPDDVPATETIKVLTSNGVKAITNTYVLMLVVDDENEGTLVIETDEENNILFSDIALTVKDGTGPVVTQFVPEKTTDDKNKLSHEVGGFVVNVFFTDLVSSAPKEDFLYLELDGKIVKGNVKDVTAAKAEELGTDPPSKTVWQYTNTEELISGTTYSLVVPPGISDSDSNITNIEQKNSLYIRSRMTALKTSPEATPKTGGNLVYIPYGTDNKYNLFYIGGTPSFTKSDFPVTSGTLENLVYNSDVATLENHTHNQGTLNPNVVMMFRHDLYSTATGVSFSVDGITKSFLVAVGGYYWDAVSSSPRYVRAIETYETTSSPAATQWLHKENLSENRMKHTATKVSDREFIVIGGVRELVDNPGTVDRDEGLALTTTVIIRVENTGSTTTRPGPTLLKPRVNHTVVPLSDGKLLVLGGTNNASNNPVVWSDGEILDTKPITTGSTNYPASILVQQMVRPRLKHAATLLPSNGDTSKDRVLIAGGYLDYDELEMTDKAEIFTYDKADPLDSVFTPLLKGVEHIKMSMPRAEFNMTSLSLPQGASPVTYKNIVLISGGSTKPNDGTNTLKETVTTEVFYPDNVNSYHFGSSDWQEPDPTSLTGAKAALVVGNEVFMLGAHSIPTSGLDTTRTALSTPIKYRHQF